MDCAGVASHLVAYHLATLDASDAETTQAIDEHLLVCRACLRTYLQLKHASERGPLDKPSPEVKRRLRGAVEQAFAKSAPAPLRAPSVLTLRIPLYQGLIAAALAASIALVGPGLVERFSSRGGTGTPVIDSARPRAESFGIY